MRLEGARPCNLLKLKQETEMQKYPLEEGFHWRDNWFFKRMPGGHVRITHAEIGHEVTQILIPPLEWASIVASVGPKGEDHGSWEKAAKLHGGTSAHEYALIDNPDPL
jgi:hypothetical protein